MNYPEELKQLCAEVERLSAKKQHRLLIIPGGGLFADHIRSMDSRFHFSASSSHRMAILAMDQYGLFLSELMLGAKLVQELGDAKKAGYAILLPSQLLFRASEKMLPHSWDVTSDSIACYIAARAKAEKLLLVKDVDGIYEYYKGKKQVLLREVSARELQDKEICVDKMLPKLLIRYKLDCCILNGRFPERLRRILEGKRAICTWVKYR